MEELMFSIKKEREDMRNVVFSFKCGFLRSTRVFLAAAAICVLAPVSALAYDPSVDRAALKAALQKYTSCTSDCAAELGLRILNESVDVGLKTVGAIKANASAPNAIKYASFYVLLRSVYESGKKIINSNAACYSSCDSLNKEIVELGRAGLLGPMLKGGNVEESTFNNPRILDAYQKFLKPIQLPAEERGAAWAKYIASLS
jgi:hypothetical protein